MIPGNDWAGRKTKKTRYVPKDAIAGEESQALSSMAINKMIDHMVKRKAVVSKMFHEVDADRSGTVDMEELGTALAGLGLWLRRDELHAIFKELDYDGDGEVDLPEFLAFFKKERAKRFDGHIPELKQAKEQFLRKLRDGGATPTPQDYHALAQIENLQTMQSVPADKVALMREQIKMWTEEGLSTAELQKRVKILAHEAKGFASRKRYPPPIPQVGGPRMGPAPRDRSRSRLAGTDGFPVPQSPGQQSSSSSSRQARRQSNRRASRGQGGQKHQMGSVLDRTMDTEWRKRLGLSQLDKLRRKQQREKRAVKEAMRSLSTGANTSGVRPEYAMFSVSLENAAMRDGSESRSGSRSASPISTLSGAGSPVRLNSQRKKSSVFLPSIAGTGARPVAAGVPGYEGPPPALGESLSMSDLGSTATGSEVWQDTTARRAKPKRGWVEKDGKYIWATIEDDLL